MQLNIRFLKKILNVIQEKQSHYTLTTDVFDDVKELCKDMDIKDYTDLFFGHLLLLKDNKVIEEIGGNNSLGIAYTNTGIQFVSCKIRLTSQGYDFIKILNQNNIIDKFKQFTLTECLKMADYLILKGVDNFIN